MKTSQQFFDEQLRRNMSVNQLGLRDADPLLVFEARMTVMARKNEKRKTSLKKYQLLFSAMVFMICSTFIFTTNEHAQREQFSNYRSENLVAPGGYSLSVISSTMLTSIPTLRN